MSPEVSAYFEKFPPEVQDRMQLIRQMIMKQAPDAVESMAYAMPGYKLNGKPLIYYAAYGKHIGLYAMEIAHAAFADRLKDYKQGKGSVQFPHSKPLPENVISEIIGMRVKALS